jgi:hypothetical protein
MFHAHDLPEHKNKPDLMSSYTMRIANHEVDDQAAHNNGEQWSHRVCQCDRYPLLVGIYDARRKEGDS